jgi:mono/diheme cytochrome c family protein
MRRCVVALSLAVLMSVIVSGMLLAAGEHEQHQHSQPVEHGRHDTHKHQEWPAAPAHFAGKISHRWGDPGAIERGKPLYDTHCTVCHGADGRGTTAFAKTLPHQPADLMHHFHLYPGDGDAYLFWRVSEGGTVEPFKSGGSLMPAFNTVLSEDERWDVLAYVCAEFHMGFE